MFSVIAEAKCFNVIVRNVEVLPEQYGSILGLHSISRDSNDKGYGSHVGVHNKRM